MNPLDEDEEGTEEERREAEALARALDRGHAPGGAPGDALEGAALLRFARHEGALDPDRSEAILRGVLETAKPRPARARLAWSFFGALGLAGAAAATAFLLRSQAPSDAVRLPPPPRALLEAQIEATRSQKEGLATLGAEMTPYRAQLYAALEARYRQ